MLKVLFAFTDVLGNKTFSSRMLTVLREQPDIDIATLHFGPDDFLRYPAPRILRKSNFLETRAVFRRKIHREGIPTGDVVMINGLGLAMELLPRIPRVPAVIATDTTPKLLRNQILRLNPPAWRRFALAASGHLQDYSLRRVLPRVRYFLPMSGWCSASLCADYGFPPSRCRVTLSPQPHAERRSSRAEGPLRLLFVGNDFQRKGGDMLLQAFRRSLFASCVLTIVSNDSTLMSIKLPDGVKLVSGLRTADDVAPIYAHHDVLLYPSRMDQFSNVIAEAAMAGVPSISTDVGGVSDLVADGETGLLIPWGAGEKDWEESVLRLAKDEAFRQQLADNCYKFANDRLSLTRFSALIAEVLAEFR